DELAVAQSVLARGGVDAHDPQPAEIALLAAAADKRVLERGVDRFFGGAIELALVGVVALRQAQELLALGAPDRSPFYARHQWPLEISDFRVQISDLLIRQHARELGRVDVRDRHRAAQLALARGRLAAQDVLLERFAPQELAALGAL